MNPTITVTANVQTGEGAIRRFTKSMQDMRKELRAVAGDMDKLSKEDQELWDQLNEHVQQGLNTKLGQSTRRRLRDLGLADAHVGQIINSRLSPNDAWDEKLKERLVRVFGGAAVNLPTSPEPSRTGNVFTRSMTRSGQQIARMFGIPLPELGAAATVGGAAVTAGAAITAAGTLDVATGAYRGMQSEQRRLVDLDHFYRQIGDASIRFESLNDAVKQATRGLRLTYEETQALVRAYAQGAALSNTGLAVAGMRNAVGFARTYGMDPGSAVAAFSSIERMGGPGQNRRIEVALSDIAASAKLTTKMPELVESLSQIITQMRLTTGLTPNMDSLMSLYGALNRSGNPAFQGAAGAGVMEAILGSFRSGGAAGMPGQVWDMAAIQRANPDVRSFFQLQRLIENPSLSARDLGIGRGTTSAIDARMASFGITRGMAGFDENAFVNSGQASGFSRLMGFGTQDKALAFIRAYIAGGEERGGRLGQLYDRYGINPENLSSDAVARLANGDFYQMKKELAGPLRGHGGIRDTGGLNLDEWRWKSIMGMTEADMVHRVVDAGAAPTAGSAIESSQAALIKANSDLGGHLVDLAVEVRQLRTAIRGGTVNPDAPPDGAAGRAQPAGGGRR